MQRSKSSDCENQNAIIITVRAVTKKKGRKKKKKNASQ